MTDAEVWMVLVASLLIIGGSAAAAYLATFCVWCIQENYRETKRQYDRPARTPR
jgi:hypothetical protein